MHTITVINHFDDVWIMYYFSAECHVIVSTNVKKSDPPGMLVVTAVSSQDKITAGVIKKIVVSIGGHR